MDDLAVLFALLGIALFFAAPLVVVVLYWRQRKLKLRFDELVANHSRQNDALHRELLEVKREVANLRQSPVAPSHAVEPTVTVAHVAPSLSL